LIGHDHPNKPVNGERMIRQSMPSGLTRGCGRFGDQIMRSLIMGARSDAKPDSTFADRALDNGTFNKWTGVPLGKARQKSKRR
jgi:hypothetical protein